MRTRKLRAQRIASTTARKVKRDPTNPTLRAEKEEEAIEVAEETEGEATEVAMEREEAAVREEVATEVAEAASLERTSTRTDSRL
jgi:phosphopantetheine adenylyltransferase